MNQDHIQRVDPDELGPASPAYAQANVVNGLIFLAGQAALDEHDRVVGENDTYAQTSYALGRVERLLSHVGSDLAHVVSAQVFITPDADFAEFNRAWKETFASIRPSRTTAVAGLVLQGCLVEIVITAAVAR